MSGILRKIVVWLCVLGMLTGGTVFAAKTQGAAGENVTWRYNSGEKALYFEGSGQMTDFAENEITPWKTYMPNVEKIVVGEGINSIGSYAFALGEKVTEISLPESLTAIGSGAFGWCGSLSEIHFPKGLRTIGDSAFVWCAKLGQVNLPAGIEEVAGNAFSWCSALTGFTVAEENKGYMAQDGVLFTKDGTVLVTYPDGRADETYRVPDTVKEIGDSAFIGNDRLRSVDLGIDTEIIESRAFFNCKNLTSAAFGPAVQRIESRAFYGCSALDEVVLPEGVLEIGENAFKKCRALTSVFIPESTVYIGEGILDETYASISGYLNSPAHVYALERGIAFREIVRVVYQGEELSFDEMPFIQDGRTLVPMRKIFETLGAEITWEDDLQRVTAVKGDTVLQITIGENVLYKNGAGIALEVPAQLVGERTFVPLRAVSEAFAVTVEWDEETSTVTLLNI